MQSAYLSLIKGVLRVSTVSSTVGAVCAVGLCRYSFEVDVITDLHCSSKWLDCSFCLQKNLGTTDQHLHSTDSTYGRGIAGMAWTGIYVFRRH